MIRSVVGLSALRLVAGAGVLLLATFGIAATERFSCPPNLSQGGGAYEDGASSVEFRSWSWEKEARYYLCHCVRNLHRNPLKVTWTDVGLTGWARLNQAVYAMSSMANGDFEVRPTELTLGRVSVQVDTLFRKPSATQSSVDATPSLQLASAKLAQAESYPPAVQQISEARIAVPAFQLISGLSIEEIDAAVQENPDLLQEVEMTFTSQLAGEGTVIRYECRYGVVNASTDSSLILQIDDPEVHASVFGSEEALYIDWSQFGRRDEIVMSGELKVGEVAPEDLVTRTTTMSFLDDAGTVIGSMPIRFLAAP